MDIRHQKDRAQQSIRERLARVSDRDRRAEGRTLSRELLKLLPAETRTIAAYMPLQAEADITLFLEEILTRGLELFLPRFGNKKLEFFRARDLQSLVPGALNIPEPPADAEEFDPLLLDLAIVPGRAFDREGWRMGRGNGGYDIWIRAQRGQNPQTQFWGVALECQILQSVPREAHDERVDTVVTARGKIV